MERKFSVLLIEYLLNSAELLGIAFILFLAFAFQFLASELPCPLCLLQRVGFICIAYGLLMNLRFGLRPSHYAITLLSCYFTSFVALRQIVLHIIPGTGSFGSPIFGLHLYTWSYIAVMVITIVTTIMMCVDRQYLIFKQDKRFNWLVHLLFAIMFLLAAANFVSVLFECGLSACPDNPTQYM